MELKRIRISNYKSITDLSLDIKKLNGSSTVILVGKNGTGKTNILQAIGFMAETDKEYNFQALKNAQNDMSDTINFYYTFSFDSQDEWQSVLESKISAPKEFFERAYINGVEKNVYLTSDSNKFKTKIRFLIDNADSFLSKFYYKAPIDDGKFEINYEKEAKSSEDANHYKKLTSTDFDKILNNIFAGIIDEYSTIDVSKWKYSKENLITETIDLNEFKENCEICLPLKNVFNLAGFETQEDIKNKIESLDLGPKNINKLEKILENSAKEHLNRVWPECRVMFKVKIQDDLKLDVYVVDEGDEENTFFITDRSEGFKQFISLIMGISASNTTNNLKGRVLIIDEPETHMHPSGIKYMRDELLRIGRNNYVFLATHSEYIIDTKNKERHYIVTKVNNSTSVHNWDNNDDMPDDEILRQAFGLDILSELLDQYNLPQDKKPDMDTYNKALKILYPPQVSPVSEDIHINIEREKRMKNVGFDVIRNRVYKTTKQVAKNIGADKILESLTKNSK